MTSPVDRIRRFHPELTAIRRDLHAHPELSFTEERTSEVVAEYLRKLGIETHVGLAKTGVVGVIPGKTKSGKGDRPARRHGLPADARTEQLSAQVQA